MNQSIRAPTSVLMGPEPRVAEQVGYSSRSHFTQQFEARYGISPARYSKSFVDNSETLSAIGPRSRQ